MLEEALKKSELSPEDGKLVQRMVPVCAALPAELHFWVDGKDIFGEFANFANAYCLPGPRIVE